MRLTMKGVGDLSQPTLASLGSLAELDYGDCDSSDASGSVPRGRSEWHLQCGWSRP